MNKSKKAKVLVLTGPTGSGKTEILKKLSAIYPIEVISADSRQIYRNMQIGTAAPDESTRKTLRHHLVQFKNPDESFSSGEFINLAGNLIKQIIDRKKIPVISGGTFFYIRSLWDGLIREPDISNEIKEKISHMNDSDARLLLKEKDFQSYKKINANDSYRIKRALMVTLASPIPFSKIEKEPGIYNDYSFHSFFIHLDRDFLYLRINKRTREMLYSGIIDETMKLIQSGYQTHTPGLRTIGYHEILNKAIEMGSPAKTESLIESLQKISHSSQYIDELYQEISQKTRNYAKRQLTWFRNEARLKSIDHDSILYHLSKIDLTGQ